MSQTMQTDASYKTLIERMSAAVRLKDVPKITQAVKTELESLIRQGKIHLPADITKPQSECYARRLIHQDHDLGYVIVAMTWGPSQGTPLHDHAGIWCVEGVISGEMKVTHFELREEKSGKYRFDEVGQTRAGVGGAGALIPPHEHHILCNALGDKPSVTLHIYGGEINQCGMFVPEKDGWYRREVKKLSYHV